MVKNMHELAITQHILGSTIKAATEAEASRIIAINLKMSDYCDYVPEIIQEYFDSLSEGTIAYGAKISVSIIPAMIRCSECAKEFEDDKKALKCPFCGSERIRIQRTNELYIEDMEIE